MKRAEFMKDANNNNLHALAMYLSLTEKTDYLIRRLAVEPFAWCDDDVTQAIKQTGVFEFSVQDVEYMRRLNCDVDYHAIKSVQGQAEKAMLTLPNDRRIVFYENVYKHIVEARNKREMEILKDFPGVVYYTKDCQ